MVKRISDRCWAAIVRELIESYYLKETIKSYREIAKDVYDKKYCSDRPSPSTIHYILAALNSLPREFRKVRLSKKEHKKEESFHQIILNYRLEILTFLLWLRITYMVHQATYTHARSRYYSELRDTLRDLGLPNEVIACYVIKLLKDMADILHDLHLSPSCFGGLLLYSGGMPVTVGGSTKKLFFKSYVNFKYVKESVSEDSAAGDNLIKRINNGIESINYLNELNTYCTLLSMYDQYGIDDRSNIDVRTIKTVINGMFKEFVTKYLPDLESLYVNVSKVLTEYVIKFRLAHAVANSLIEVVKNHECLKICSGSIEELVRCFRRKRRGIKSTSLAKAFSYFEEDLKISLSEEAKQELKQSLSMRIQFTPSNNSAIRVTTTITTYVVLK